MADGAEVTRFAREQLGNRRLPKWSELPDFELYMDQVLALIGRYLGEEAGSEKLLTASMVNNYVKLGVMPPPVKKRYDRGHIAHLLMICVLKQVLSIGELKELLHRDAAKEMAEAYDRFQSMYGEMNTAVAMEKPVPGEQNYSSPEDEILCAALRAQAEQTVARGLLSNPTDPE